ncbi:hypothetical protein F5887DRAFT_529177 [Amanita rubescens]|nr:hypothetical protein F5887DRAFT_529177 [Amanita rubescens]
MVSLPISYSPSKLVALIVPRRVQGRSVLLPRTASTNATCGSRFLWMENSEGQHPCLLASTLSGACFPGNWNISLINPSDVYGTPSIANANYCSCSWAVYNLLQACTTCQANDNILRWNAYIINCESYLTNTTFPIEKVVLPNNTRIPYWSAVNPAIWSHGRFNVTQAQALQSYNYSDISLSNRIPTTHKSSTSVDIIAGGIVGGIIAAVLVAVAVSVLHLRRYRRCTSARMITFHECIICNTWQRVTGSATVVDTRQTPTPSTVYSSISLSSPIFQTWHLFPPPQSSVMQMSVQPVANAAAMGNPEDAISRFTLTSTQREIYPIYEESWSSSAVNDRNWEPALINSHFPAAHLVDYIGRVHRPRMAMDSMDLTITPGNRDEATNSDSASLTKQMPPGSTSDLDSGPSGTYFSARSSFISTCD